MSSGGSPGSSDKIGAGAIQRLGWALLTGKLTDICWPMTPDHVDVGAAVPTLNAIW